jgi:hypothetical protein
MGFCCGGYLTTFTSVLGKRTAGMSCVRKGSYCTGCTEMCMRTELQVLKRTITLQGKITLCIT